MRIGVNTLAAVPGKSGGDGTYVRSLVRHLANTDSTNTYFIFIAPYNRIWFDVQQENVRYVLCQVPNNYYLRVAWEQTVLPIVIRRMKLDVFHATVNVSPALLVTPTVLTIHDVFAFMPEVKMPLPLRLYWRVFRSWSAYRSIAVIVMSDGSAPETHQLMGVPTDKLHRIYNGVDHRFQPLDRSRCRELVKSLYGVEDRFILWVGRPYANKNVARIIEAFAQVAAILQNVHLVLVGPDGWESAQLSDAIGRSGLGTSVHMLGYVPNEELPTLYNAADAFLFPSLKETFGFPIVEAMACGTPVVTSITSVLPEIAGGAAELVDPTNVESIAQGVLNVLNNADRWEQLRARGLQRAIDFDWNSNAAQTLELYTAVYTRVAQQAGN